MCLHISTFISSVCFFRKPFAYLKAFQSITLPFSADNEKVMENGKLMVDIFIICVLLFCPIFCFLLSYHLPSNKKIQIWFTHMLPDCQDDPNEIIPHVSCILHPVLKNVCIYEFITQETSFVLRKYKNWYHYTLGWAGENATWFN